GHCDREWDDGRGLGLELELDPSCGSCLQPAHTWRVRERDPQAAVSGLLPWGQNIEGSAVPYHTVTGVDPEGCRLRPEVPHLDGVGHPAARVDLVADRYPVICSLVLCRTQRPGGTTGVLRLGISPRGRRGPARETQDSQQHRGAPSLQRSHPASFVVLSWHRWLVVRPCTAAPQARNRSVDREQRDGHRTRV